VTGGFVADSSIGVAWVVPAQSSSSATELLDRILSGTRFFVPALWPFEVSNALLALTRRGKIGNDHYRRAVDALRRLTPVIDEDGPRLALGQTSDLAARHRLSVYDASYLELAIRRRLPLASRDTALISAAKKHELEVL
jgi:predicted nucleic acid-binding protein